jgi:hypothetical protein
MAYIDPEIRKQIKKETRLWDLTDMIWAILIGFVVARWGVDLLAYLHVFDKAKLDTWFGTVNLVGSAISLSRLGAFIVAFIITLIVRYNRKNREE